jgi:hypothetical protein
VHVLAGFQRQQRVPAVVAHVGFDSHDLGALEEFVQRDQPCAELLTGSPAGFGGIVGPDELPVGRVHRQLDLVRAVGVAGTQESDRDWGRIDRLLAGCHGADATRERGTAGTGTEK